MSLSDRERRLLAEMEAALATDDPKLQSTLTSTAMAPSRSSSLAGLALIFTGFCILFGGLVAKVTPISVLGFLIALGGVLLLIRSFSRGGARARGQKTARKPLSARLEERWDRRNNQ